MENACQATSNILSLYFSDGAVEVEKENVISFIAEQKCSQITKDQREGT